MLLHNIRSNNNKVLEVFLVFIFSQSALSASLNSATDDDEFYNRFNIYENAASASDIVTAFTHSPAFEAFLNMPIAEYAEQNAKETVVPESYLPAPLKKKAPVADEPKEYFEESQKKPKTAPKPSKFSDDEEDSDDFEEDEEESKEEVETASPPPLKKRKNKKKKVKASPTESSDFDAYPSSYSFDALRRTTPQEALVEQSKVVPSYYGTKNVDYNTGKSSSTVAHQYPVASGYAPVRTPTTSSPYSNYKALQSKYLAQIASTPRSAKNTESRNLNSKDDGVQAQSENKDCRKIEGPENAENMDCFVCEDAVNKAKFTQCSYASHDQPINQYAGSSVRYSVPVKAPLGYRFKRSPKRGGYSDDPYSIVSERNRKYFDDIEKEQAAAESEREKDYHYSPYGDEDYESYSESQSAELLKEPGACTKVDRDGMTCTVCKNSKTGGNFEQCSYTSAPKEQKYAYVAEKKFDSDDDPEESKNSQVVTKEEETPKDEDPQKASSSAPVPQISAIAPSEDSQFASATKSRIVLDPIPELTAAGSEHHSSNNEENPEDDDDDDEESFEQDTKKKEKQAEDFYYSPAYYNYGDLKKNKPLVNEDPYDVPEHFAASISQEKKANNDDDDDAYDEYHYKLFPNELSKPAESRAEELTSNASEESQQDVEEVLAEFAKKDRSQCKKAQKNGMTCFLCIDENKVQHEECMYVAESKPKPSHIAYHEVQRLKDPNKLNNQPLLNVAHDEEESKKIEIKEPSSSAIIIAADELAAAASGVHSTVVPYEKEKKRYVKETIKDSKASASAPDSERLEDESKQNKSESEEPETPKEIEVGDEEGAYSHETEPVFSKQYGTILPKYMVEKTDYEKEFDAVSGF